MRYPNLEAEMSRAGVTRLQIAECLGKDKSTISMWMNGKYSGFSVFQAQRVRDKFFPRLSIDYLFDEEPVYNTKAEVS